MELSSWSIASFALAPTGAEIYNNMAPLVRSVALLNYSKSKLICRPRDASTPASVGDSLAMQPSCVSQST